MEPGQPGGRSHEPLFGVRALDFTGRMGAYCGRLLACLGADVVKVELPSGDRLRFVPPMFDGTESRGLLFSYYHHNQRGVTLDWRRDDAAELLRELAATADVVLATPRGEPETITGFRFDPPTLTWAAQDSLVCFITPFGLSGPYRDWRATPFTSFAMSGHMFPFGPEEGPPVAMPGQQFCDEAGAWAAFLIVATLQGPPRLRCQVIDQSIHEVGLFYELGLPPYSAGGLIRTRVTNFGVPPSGIWQCRDGLVDIAAHSDHHWDIFVELLGRPEVLADPMYRDRRMRIELHDLLTDVITDVLATHHAADFVDSGQAAGLPCALTQTPAQFVQGDQPRARGFFIESEPGVAGSVAMPGAPFRSSPSLTSFRRSAPALGGSNEEIYVHELGHSLAELEHWRSDGLV
jgi:crotonobetainyl-CoA:carnitine CoA-transferase CaiB-like acyl-CoA transferase